ncbi:MAG: hypothetical protein AAF928_20070 [Myxococcota bacterium]
MCPRDIAGSQSNHRVAPMTAGAERRVDDVGLFDGQRDPGRVKTNAAEISALNSAPKSLVV